MNTTTCRRCGARIVFIKTLKGKYMPCDELPVHYQMNGEGNRKIVTPVGVVVTGSIVKDPGKATGHGYVPHWSTCTAPDQFRK